VAPSPLSKLAYLVEVEVVANHKALSHKQSRSFLTNLTSSLSKFQKPFPSIFSLIFLLMDPSVRDITLLPKHDAVVKNATTQGVPSGSNVDDITDHNTVAGNSDMSGLEGTTDEHLASSKRCLRLEGHCHI
jgi:hypothetical protein